MTTDVQLPDHHVEPEQRVTPLELFFDLVFVFALTQVTALMSENPTWTGLGQGLLVLGALWWAWTAYAWLTNTINPEQGGIRLAMFAAMAAMLVASLATPGAFASDGLLFGCAYFVVRALHIVLYAAASHDVDIQAAVKRLAPSAFVASGLLIAAGTFDGAAQATLWVLALAIDFAGPILGGMGGWRVSAGHFAERHGLIIIIALGESIVAVGVGASGLELDAGVVAAAIMGTVVVASIWWAYFDVVALVAERRLRQAEGLEQVRMARDSYSYLHFPMIAGIVLIALGIKKTIGDVGQSLDPVPAVALTGGVAVYLLGHIGFRLRNVRSLNRQRLVVAVVCLALIPLAMTAPALVTLATLAALTAGLVAFEAIRFGEARARVRSAA